MTVKPLTKEQKLDIVSNAIDAGAHIDISFHANTRNLAPVNELESIFSGMRSDISGSTKEKSRWINFLDGEDIVFRGVIFLPHDLPKEWQDSGDKEEANV